MNEIDKMKIQIVQQDRLINELASDKNILQWALYVMSTICAGLLMIIIF